MPIVFALMSLKFHYNTTERYLCKVQAGQIVINLLIINLNLP